MHLGDSILAGRRVFLAACLHAAFALTAPAQPALVEVYGRAYPEGEADTSPEVRAARRLVDGTWALASTGDLTFLDRIDLNGRAVSTQRISTGTLTDVQIDPFGDALALLSGNSVRAPRLQKLDGRSGRTVWLREVDLASGYTLAVSHFVDAAGDVVLSGRFRFETTYVSLPFAVKLDGATGRTLWGPVFLADPNSEGVRASLDPRGDLVLAWARFAGSVRSFAIRKLSGATGEELWETVELSTVHGSPDAYRLTVAPTGDVFVVAEHWPSSREHQQRMVKVDGRSGRRSWQRVEARPNRQEAFEALADEGGSLVLTFSESDRSSILRLRSRDGQQAWAISLPESIRAAGLVPGGDVLVAASSNDDLRLRRLRRTGGADAWPPLPLGPSARTLLSVGGAGALVATRELRSRLALVDLEAGAFSASPATLARPAPNWMSLAGVATGPAGELFAIGWGPYEAVRLVRIAPDTGDLIWVSESVDGLSWAVLYPDARGDVLLAGQSPRGPVRFKVRGDSGALVWGPFLEEDPGPGSTGVVFHSAQVDPDGNLVIAESLWWSDTVERDLVAVKVSGQNGGVLWRSSAARVSEWPLASVSTDPEGGVVLVLGDVEGSRLRMRVARLRAADGQPVLGPDLLAGWRGSAYGPVWDRNGDPSLLLSEGRSVFYTLHVSGQNGQVGQVAWGPVLEEDLWMSYTVGREPYLAVDGSGDVYVAGQARDRLRLRKRDRMTGQVLWSVEWGGPLNDLEVTAVNFDPQGVLYLTASYRQLVTSPSEAATALLGFDTRDGSLVLEPFRNNPYGWLGWPVPLDGDLFLFYGGIRRLTTHLGFGPPGPLAFACAEELLHRVPVKNGVPPVVLELSGGSLPAGVSLSPSGLLHGVPQETGVFEARVRARDATGSTAERPLELAVAEGSLRVTASPDLICAGGATLLQVEGVATDYLWLPGGETTAAIVVAPSQTTTYVVEAGAGSRCRRRGSVTVVVSPEDTSAPEVSPPPATLVLQSVCSGRTPGASSATSSALASFLAASTAWDACDTSPRRLPPRYEGRDVTSASFFPAGEAEVSFPFADLSANEGEGTSRLTVWALGDVDLSYSLEVADLQVLAAYLVGNVSPGTPPFRAQAVLADANRDGRVDVLDLVSLASLLVGNLGCLTP